MKKLIGKMTNRQQREFALICASRAVDRVNVPELNEFFMLVCFAVESGMLVEIKGSAAYRAAYSAADWAEFQTTYSATGSTACWAAYSAAERGIQEQIALNILNKEKK